MEYTKGEWKVFNTNHFDQQGLDLKIATRQGGASIALIDHNQRQDFDGNWEEMKTNAHLIAAAPDMYEALKLYMEHQKGTSGHYCSDCYNAIEKALVKAEGK